MAETIHKDGNVEIEYMGALTALQVSDLREKLADHFRKTSGVTLIFSETDECDSLGIQLLCSAGKTAAASDKSFVLKGDVDAILDMTDRMGLVPEKYFTLEKKEN